MAKRYVAYVGSYNYTGNAKGITIYDVDMEHFGFVKREEVPVNNASYVTASHDKKKFYSVANEGINGYTIDRKTGSLHIDSWANINGMRACHLYIDRDDNNLYVSGYHDGKFTIIPLDEKGNLVDEGYGIVHKGLGSVADRAFRPHVSCTKRTPDGRFVMVADLGQDYIKIYQLDDVSRRLNLVDSLIFPKLSAPRYFIFSRDDKFLYVMTENSCEIYTYRYEAPKGCAKPSFNLVDHKFITNKKPEHFITEEEEKLALESDDCVALKLLQARIKNLKNQRAATCLTFSSDDRYLLCGSEGDNTVSVYERNPKDGILTFLFCLPISGDYPKDLLFFPDNIHFASINQNSNEITFFKINYEKKYFSMCHKSVSVSQPSCGIIVELDEDDSEHTA